MTLKCITPKEMRDINRTCILEYLRRQGVVSRSAIATDLSLSLSSVVRITDELMEERLVHLQGEYEFSGGRRRPLIELDTQQNVVVSIVLGGNRTTACLCDITGNLLETRVLKTDGRKGEQCIDLVKSLADEMLGLVGHRRVRGISVGVPGVVIDGNRVIAAPAVGLNNFRLADRLTPHYECPVLVENDVNLAALGEMWFGYGKQCDDLVYIHVGTLIGMGVVLGRCILRGAHTAAGELGYLLLEPGQLSRQYESMGALEERISGFGLGKRVREALAAQGKANKAATAVDLFALAAEGERWAQEIVHDFVETLSLVLVDVATLFDPEIIVLGGGVMESAEAFMGQVRRYIHGKTPHPIRVERTELGANVTVLGGCTNVMQHAMHYTLFRSMV